MPLESEAHKAEAAEVAEPDTEALAEVDESTQETETQHELQSVVQKQA